MGSYNSYECRRERERLEADVTAADRLRSLLARIMDEWTYDGFNSQTTMDAVAAELWPPHHR